MPQADLLCLLGVWAPTGDITALRGAALEESVSENQRYMYFYAASQVVMSIGNQKFGIPRKYQYQIGIWYCFPKFLGIFLVFYRYFEKALVKIWLNIGIFGTTKIGLVFGFCCCHFIGIGLVSVRNFPENGTSTLNV